MKIILQDVTINQTSLKEVADKKSGVIKSYRNVDIFIPRDVDDAYSKSKAITANCAETPDGVASFNYLLKKEGQRVSLLVDHQEGFSYKDKNGGMVHREEGFKILQVIDSASIKSVEMPKMKAA